MASNTKQFIDEKEGLMIRVDKTIGDLNSEKPSSRWDPSYWHPNYEKLLKEIRTTFECTDFGDYIDVITYGQVGKRVLDPNGSVAYIQTINMISTGIDYDKKQARIKLNSHNDPERSRIVKEDILFGNAGAGGLGKVTISLSNTPTNISQDIDLIRMKNINPYYIVIFLKTKYGNKQIWIRSRGVGAPKIPFEEIKAIKIPILPLSIQRNIESEYKKMSAFHDKAMEAKSKKDQVGYEGNIKIAEGMLQDLIAKTEAVIRGEREDVV